MISPIRFDNYYFAIVLSILLTFFTAYKKAGVILSACLFYVLFSSLHVALYPFHPYDQMNQYSQLAIIIIALYAFKNVVLFFVPCFLIKDKHLDFFLDVFYAVGLLSSFIVFHHFITRDSIPYGLVLNASSEGNFLGMLAPVALFRNYKRFNWTKPIIPIAAILTTSSMGIGCVVLTVLMYAFLNKFYKIIIAAIFIFISSWIYVGSNLFSSSGRFEYWKWFMVKWYQNCDHWLGSGAGSFSYFGKWLQKVYQHTPDGVYFPTLHSDILQVIFEYGYVGGILTLALIVQVFYLSIKKKKLWLTCTVFNTVIISFLNMPWRYNMTALLGCLLLRFVFRKEKNLQESFSVSIND